MGANSTRATQVMVSNGTAAYVGTTPATALNNEMFLVNRAGAVVPDLGTVTSDINNDVLRVALGTSATAGVVEWSAPIHVRSVRKVTQQSYEAPVQHVVTIDAASAGTVTAGKVYSIKINFHDTNDLINSGKDSGQYFTYTAVTGDTATTVYDALRAKINAVNASIKQVVASGTTTLILTGIAVADNALGAPQFRYFDVSLRKGFTYTAGSSVVATAGKPGRGTGLQIRQMELSGKYGFNRTQFPVDTDTRRGVAGTTYDTITIEFGTPHLSVQHSTYVAPQTVVLAFEVGSPKKAVMLEKLTGLIESAGIYVSDVVPA